MVNIKEATAEKHKAAESTLFMKRIFEKNLPQELWVDWTFQKVLFYSTIENAADQMNLLDDLPGIHRSAFLLQDYHEMAKNADGNPVFKESVKEYFYYLNANLSYDSSKILAHLYTWHMGDLYGGQMIRTIIPGSHKSLTFENPKILIDGIRSKLRESMISEVNVAFDWAIKMLKEYDGNLA